MSAPTLVFIRAANIGGKQFHFGERIATGCGHCPANRGSNRRRLAQGITKSARFTDISSCSHKNKRTPESKGESP